MNLNADEIYSLIRNGTGEEISSFISDSPPNSFKDSAAILAKSENRLNRVLAMTSLVMPYANGGNPKLGSELALATHRMAIELYESGEKNLAKTTITNLGFQVVNALNLQGRSREVIDFCSKYVPIYKKLDEPENLSSVLIAKAAAFLNLKELDEAETVLSDKDLQPNWANQIEYKRLRKKIEDAKGGVTSLQQKNQSSDSMEDEMLKILEKMAEQMGTSAPGIKELMGKLTDSTRIDPKTPEGHRQLLDAMKIGDSILTKGATSHNEWTMKAKVREASGIFMRSPSREEISFSLKELKEALQWATENHITELANDALWGIYLCHSRLKEPSLAADAVLQLRSNLEELRKGIKDPLKRGGVFSMYPYLFPAACEKLQQSHRTKELLVSIEASKGRAIADILTRESENIVADAYVNRSVESIPLLAKRENFHYLTYFIDDEKTYAVLVDKTGEIRAIDPIKLSRAEITEASSHLDPADWGHGAEYDDSVLIEDTSEVLAPMISWMEEFFQAGIISKGDHICYSADENFSNVPLHYLKFLGGRLQDFVSVSRIHSAFQLEHVLNAPNRKYSQFLAFAVPARQDVIGATGKEMVNNLRRPALYLERHGLKGRIFADQTATLSVVQKESLMEKLIHFSTHGFFPRLEPHKNPFQHSGLLLSDGKSLPDKDQVSSSVLQGVLTPELILNFKLELNGSHVTMMACVSGLSREGIGGDALGTEWAFIQAGASSILSSHWNVSAANAAEYMELFYEEWLVKGGSRAAAHRNTIKRIQEKGTSWKHPSQWAAFSVTGDWR